MSLEKLIRSHTPNVRSWLARHPRFVLHFTPTSSSWLNTVETYLAAHNTTVPDLITAIEWWRSR